MDPSSAGDEFRFRVRGGLSDRLALRRLCAREEASQDQADSSCLAMVIHGGLRVISLVSHEKVVRRALTLSNQFAVRLLTSPEGLDRLSAWVDGAMRRNGC